jgi:hypothetical protein
MRSSADAFLSKKVIVCEGATESGFLRGMDNLWGSKEFLPFSYRGVAVLDANSAGKIKSLAMTFNALHYDVLALADADAPNHFSPSDETELKALGVSVVTWSDSLAIEQRAIFDLPWFAVLASISLAQDLGFPVHDNVSSKLNGALDPEMTAWVDSPVLRKAIGDAAKSSSWFKNMTNGERWVDVISAAFNDQAFRTRDLATKLDLVREWIDRG